MEEIAYLNESFNSEYANTLVSQTRWSHTHLKNQLKIVLSDENTLKFPTFSLKVGRLKLPYSRPYPDTTIFRWRNIFKEPETFRVHWKDFVKKLPLESPIGPVIRYFDCQLTQLAHNVLSNFI